MTAASAGSSRYSKAVGLLPVFVSLAAIVTVYIRGESFLCEPEYLVGVADTVFAAIIPAIVAFFAARAYLKTGSLNVLLMGCGMLVFGLCTGSAGWLRVLPGGADFEVTVYNAGALLGSLCHLAGSMLGPFGQSRRWKPERKPILIAAYSTVLIFAVLFSFATIQHVFPPFFTQDVGPTAIRQIVLGLAIFFYAASALLLMKNFLRIKSDFLYWYSLCLAMVALGLLASYIERIVGSPIGLVGRLSNYVGSIFSLIAILAAVKSARSDGLSLEEVISGFFVDAEATYRSLVETASDAIISFDRANRIILWNSGARKIFGYSKVEVIGSSFFGMLIPEEYESTFAELIATSRGANSQKTVEIVGRRNDGDTFPIEMSAFVRKVPGGLVTTCIMRDITQRKRMEKEVLRSRDELEMRVRERTDELLKATLELKEKAEIIDFAHDAVFVRDLDGKITFWNKGALETYGYKEEEALGQLSNELLKTTLPMPLDTIIETILEKGEWKGEIKQTRANGERIVVDSRWAIRAGRDGKPTEFLEINRDITARKIAEEGFRKVDRAFRTLSEFNQAMVRQTDEMELLRKGCRIVVDQGGYRMARVGFVGEDEEKTVMPIASAGYEEGYLDQAKITWADDKRGRGPCGASIRTGKMVISQNTLSNPDFAPLGAEAARRGYASCISLPLIVENVVIGALEIFAAEHDAFDEGEANFLSILADNLAYGIASIRSAEKRRKSEQAVIAEHKRFFEVLETLPPMICLLTRDYQVAFANRSFRERFGESHGGRCYEYCFDRKAPCDYCQAYKVLETHRPHHWELAAPGGGVLDAYAFPFTDVDGSPMVLEMNIDITDRRRAEANLSATVTRLELINKELEEFAFVAAHDLQEPLRKIQTFSDMAMKRCSLALDAAGREYLDRVVNSASRMRELLDDLLEFSRVAAKREPFQKLDLASVVREAADVFEGSIKERGCLIEIENIPDVEADRNQMVLLFQNLIGNALKYCAEPAPHVRIHGKAGINGVCEIFVEDNGVGFEQKYAERIFKPFQRLHGRGEYQGTGMGLAVCRKIVERHGGTIRAQSEPDKGSTFIIHLPAKQARLDNVIDG